MDTIHPLQDTILERQEKEILRSCHLCSGTFSTEILLKNHIKLIHKDIKNNIQLIGDFGNFTKCFSTRKNNKKSKFHIFAV